MIQSQSLPDGDQQCADLLEQITQRLQRGEAVTLELLQQQYPQQAEQLQQLLPTIRLMLDLGDSVSDGVQLSPGVPPDGVPSSGLLGDYRIFREIGRGGMGVVYEAEQISLGRRVALKVLPFAAVLDERQLKRFRNEARAAATLDHPHIVPVHAIGCERGVHFYAMSLINGRTLAQVIADMRDSRAESATGTRESDRVKSQAAAGHPTSDDPTLVLATARGPWAGPDAETQRNVQAAISTDRSVRDPQFFRTVARLGIEAASALDHAHASGVVHRDIKPANLMIDATGKLWITDFGLARLETDAGMTMTGDLLGTLRYMSPEQALAKRVIVDHRTDIYSLGVTLYELLTLRPAFDGADREVVLRQIAFDEPRRLRRHNRAVPLELETIVLKAMEKNPDARYASAQDLADDLSRFLEDRPIAARRATWAQIAAKWSRRHRPIVWSALAMLLLAVILLSISSFLLTRKQWELKTERDRVWQQFQRAESAEKKATQERYRAEQAAAKADAINRFVSEEILWQADPERNPVAAQLTVREALDRAAKRIDSAFPDQPELKSALHQTIARSYHGLGAYAESANHYRAALALTRDSRGEADLEVIQLEIALGRELTALNQWPEADMLLRGTLDRSHRTHGVQSAATINAIAAILELACAQEKFDVVDELQKLCGGQFVFTIADSGVCSAVQQLAEQLGQLHRTKDFERLAREVLAARRRFSGNEAQPTYEAAILVAGSVMQSHQWQEAEHLLRTSKAGLARLLGPEHPKALEAESWLGGLLGQQKRFDEAEQILQHYWEASRRTFGPDHPTTLDGLTNLAWLEAKRNRPLRAIALLRQNVEAVRTLRGEEYLTTIQMTNRLAQYLLQVGEYAETERLARRNAELAEKQLGMAHSETGLAVWLTDISLLMQNKFLDEIEYGLAHLGVLVQSHGGADVDGSAHRGLAEEFLTVGAFADAEEWARNSLQAIQQSENMQSPISLAATQSTLGRVLVARGRAAEAEPHLRQCLEIRQEALLDGHWLVADTRGQLGECLMRLGKHAEAEPLICPAAAVIVDSTATSQELKARALERAVTLHQVWDKPAEAARWAVQLLNLLQEHERVLERTLPPDDVRLSILSSEIGGCLLTLGRVEEAKSCLLPAYESIAAAKLRASPGALRSYLDFVQSAAAERVAQLRVSEGASQEAEAWRALAIAELPLRDVTNMMERQETSIRNARDAAEKWRQLLVAAPDRADFKVSYGASCCAVAQALSDKTAAAEKSEWLERAEAILSEVLATDPSEARGREYLWLANTQHAMVLLSQNQLDAASADFEASLSLRVVNRAVLHAGAWLMANAPNIALRNPARAIELAQRGVEEMPQDAVLWRILGGAHYRAGKWKEALDALNKSVEIHPKGGGFNSWILLAMTHFQLGDRPQAQHWFNKAAEALQAIPEPSEEMRALSAEAAELLGVSPPEPAMSPSSTGPEKKKSADR